MEGLAERVASEQGHEQICTLNVGFGWQMETGREGREGGGRGERLQAGVTVTPARGISPTPSPLLVTQAP